MLLEAVIVALAKEVVGRLWAPDTDGPPPEPVLVGNPEVVVEARPQPPIPFDNLQGTSPFTVRRTFTAEWTQTCEVRDEHTTGTKAGATVGTAGAKLQFAAEEAIKTAFALTETKRTTRSDEVTFDVPPGVRRDVRVDHRYIWQRGVVRFERASGAVDVPFRVLTNVEIGYRFADQT